MLGLKTPADRWRVPPPDQFFASAVPGRPANRTAASRRTPASQLL